MSKASAIPSTSPAPCSRRSWCSGTWSKHLWCTRWVGLRKLSMWLKITRKRWMSTAAVHLVVDQLAVKMLFATSKRSMRTWSNVERPRLRNCFRKLTRPQITSTADTKKKRVLRARIEGIWSMCNSWETSAPRSCRNCTTSWGQSMNELNAKGIGNESD